MMIQASLRAFHWPLNAVLCLFLALWSVHGQAEIKGFMTSSSENCLVTLMNEAAPYEVTPRGEGIKDKGENGGAEYVTLRDSKGSETLAVASKIEDYYLDSLDPKDGLTEAKQFLQKTMELHELAHSLGWAPEIYGISYTYDDENKFIFQITVYTRPVGNVELVFPMFKEVAADRIDKFDPNPNGWHNWDGPEGRYWSMYQAQQILGDRFKKVL